MNEITPGSPVILTTQRLEAAGLYRIPTEVYQIMADAICTSRQGIEGRWQEETGSVQRVRKILEEYVADRHPGMVLNGFIDLNNKDVQDLECRGVRGLTWGMYYAIRSADDHLMNDPLLKITELLLPSH